MKLNYSSAVQPPAHRSPSHPLFGLLAGDDAQCLVSKSVPAFPVFRYLDAYPRIADADLDALRLAEQRGRPKRKARTFATRELIRLMGGGFEGLAGTVQGSRGQYTLVTFGDWHIAVSIAAINLLPARIEAA